MRSRIFWPLLFAFLLTGASGALARDYFVSPSGNDSNDGSIGSPMATVQAAFLQTAPGDTVQVRAGTYAGGVTIWGDAYSFKCGAPGAPITVRAYDGDLTAHIGRLALQPGQYLNFEGLDVGTSDVQSINLCGIETSYRVYVKSHHVQIKRCRFSMTDSDGVDGGGNEIFKGAQGDYWTIEDCELRVPDNNGFDKSGVAMDFVGVNYTTVRRLYIHDYNKVGVYWKGGSMYDVLEDSVIANGRTDWTDNYGISMGGDGSGIEYANPASSWGVEYMVVRNNIVRRSTKGAVQVSASNCGYVYNNLFADCAKPIGGGVWGIVTCMTYPGSDQGDNMVPAHTRLFNNIILDTAGTMNWVFFDQLGGATDFVTGNNCYWNKGGLIPAGNLAGVSPSSETGAVTADPMLSLTGTPTTWQGWVDYYRPTSTSTAIRDTGSSTAGDAPYPAVIDDIEGNGRPQGGAWDIGPYEYPGTPSKPTANFTSGQATGSPPLTVDFQDLSLAAPTSWAWDFGDGGSSTERNPSHTYMAMGYHDVSLTVTNGAGSDSVTKTNYVHVLPLVADFGVDTTWGGAPLTVTFSDYSSGAAPTAWNWAFGDRATSTAESPSHTYAATGLYTVSLTATNALGSDTCTKPGYISVCTLQTYAPTDWRARFATDAAHLLKPDCGTIGTIQPSSGTVANLAAKDGSYIEFPSILDGTSYICFVGCYLNTPYTPDQILAVHVDTTARSSDPNSPGEDWYMYSFPGQNCTPGDAWAFDWYVPNWGTDWRDMSKTFQVSNYPGLVSDSGEIMAVWWAGGATAYDSQLDYVKYTLYVKPGAFTDVPTDNWAWAQIEACVAAGIVQGYADGSYQPLAVVNRGQMAVYIARALCGGDSLVPTSPATAHFPDVPTDFWAFKYVEYAYSQNIVTGYANGNYQPNDNVDRGQMAVFIARSIVNPTGDGGLASFTPPATASFPDVATDFWSFKHVEYLKQAKVVGGYADGKYHPEYTVTRDQMAVFVCRAFNLLP